MNLPALFDADNPTHRYRARDCANQLFIRPVLHPHGWDHDVGYEGINVEHLHSKKRYRCHFRVRLQNTKKDANLQMEQSKVGVYEETIRMVRQQAEFGYGHVRQFGPFGVDSTGRQVYYMTSQGSMDLTYQPVVAATG
ncbi:translocon outer complex protein [Artemisia annua]|uniref:Translocon outer complex protein n=1 Tax=Artemisia annua TaxID=35608 RepID=A0A2U1KMV4_ARTAN|nr:translocon outer complex protein [Artemisia annua]